MVEKLDATHRIVKLVKEAQVIASAAGMPNTLQPGLVKEMIVADILGHEIIPSKRAADACDPNDTSIQFEYLSCYEGGSGQFDRMFKSPASKRRESLTRITRNRFIYLAVFFKRRSLDVKVIYEIDPQIMVRETERQLDRSRNVISHVGFSEAWARTHGRVVYQSGD